VHLLVRKTLMLSKYTVLQKKQLCYNLTNEKRYIISRNTTYILFHGLGYTFGLINTRHVIVTSLTVNTCLNACVQTLAIRFSSLLSITAHVYASK
jgi:hypothetical protein